MRNGIFTLSLLAALTGCSSLTFVNGPTVSETIVREHWHHLGIMGLVEFSEPMNIHYNCGAQEWDSITVELTVFNNFAQAASAPAISLYSPWTIIYECREPLE